MMTELENTDRTDNLSTENVTVTSDTAFERVTSDIKMEEGEDGGYLKQNTAGLVQEIPNISFLDIADTMLESKKTLYERKNWNIVVGMAGASIEAQPQDIGIFWDVKDDTQSGLGAADFNEYTSGTADTCFTPQGGHIFKVEIDGIYRVSYSFSIGDIDSTATGVARYIALFRGGVLKTINQQFFGHIWSGQPIGIESYSNSGSTHIDLKKGDLLSLYVKVADTNGDGVSWKYKYAEFTLQFQQYQL